MKQVTVKQLLDNPDFLPCLVTQDGKPLTILAANDSPSDSICLDVITPDKQATISFAPWHTFLAGRR